VLLAYSPLIFKRCWFVCWVAGLLWYFVYKWHNKDLSLFHSVKSGMRISGRGIKMKDMRIRQKALENCRKYCRNKYTTITSCYSWILMGTWALVQFWSKTDSWWLLWYLSNWPNQGSCWEGWLSSHPYKIIRKGDNNGVIFFLFVYLLWCYQHLKFLIVVKEYEGSSKLRQFFILSY
jgi:hypothetical protein